MSTTNLFVELVVIGVGAAIWVTLLVLSLFGWTWIPVDKVFSTEALVPLIAVIYLLGIVTDRIGDAVVERLFVRSMRSKFFPQVEDYHRARLVILSRSERLAQMLEYGRSRLRICRGWAFNSLLIVIFTNSFVWARLADEAFAWSLSLFATLGFLLLAAGSWYSWRKLAQTEYIKTKEQSQYLAGQESPGRISPQRRRRR